MNLAEMLRHTPCTPSDVHIIDNPCRKYDKRVGGREGAAFLQHCWQGDNLKLGAILHSPLLSELQGLETRLRSTTAAAVDRHVMDLVEVDGARRSRSGVRQVGAWGAC